MQEFNFVSSRMDCWVTTYISKSFLSFYHDFTHRIDVSEIEGRHFKFKLCT